MDKGLANPICTERRGLVWPNIFLVTIFSSWFLNSMSWTLCTWFNDSDTWVSGSRRGRVVKASDLKSDSLWERRFESCRLRDFCKKNSHLHRLIMKSHNYHVCIVAVVAEWLRRLTRNQIPSGSVGSSPTDCDISFKLHFNYWVIIKKLQHSWPWIEPGTITSDYSYFFLSLWWLWIGLSFVQVSSYSKVHGSILMNNIEK